jgi:preprotein translocase subunit SecG
MLRDLLLTLNMIVCLALIGVVLMQRSEGGALGSGSPTGLVTARGAGDLLTRTTWVLFSLFLALSLSLTLVGGRERSSQALLERLKKQSVNPETLATHPAPPPSSPGAAKPAPVTPTGVAPPTAPPTAPTAAGGNPLALPDLAPAAPKTP